MDKTEEPSRKRFLIGLIAVLVLAGLVAVVWSRARGAMTVLALFLGLFALLLHGCGNYGDNAGTSKPATYK
jgi:hypothetical protein